MCQVLRRGMTLVVLVHGIFYLRIVQPLQIGASSDAVAFFFVDNLHSPSARYAGVSLSNAIDMVTIKRTIDAAVKSRKICIRECDRGI